MIGAATALGEGMGGWEGKASVLMSRGTAHKERWSRLWVGPEEKRGMEAWRAENASAA